MQDRQEMHERADVVGLGEAVRRRRRELGLTQQQLAELADVSTRFVHTVEHGKATLTLEPLLDVLGVLGLGLRVAPGRGAIEVDG